MKKKRFRKINLRERLYLLFTINHSQKIAWYNLDTEEWMYW